MTPAIDPLSFLYQSQESAFPGYRPEASFSHGAEVCVARVRARHAQGMSSDIRETRMPARFFSATSTGNGLVLTWGTGSGSEAGQLLHEVCEGLADGRVRLSEPADAGAWRHKKKFLQEPDGCATEVHVSGIARVDVEERHSLFGRTGPMTLYFTDVELALRTAQAMSEGMLSLKISRS
jgi:hypothetical protein